MGCVVGLWGLSSGLGMKNACFNGKVLGFGERHFSFVVLGYKGKGTKGIESYKDQGLIGL